jgi:hypothetical protein
VSVKAGSPSERARAATEKYSKKKSKKTALDFSLLTRHGRIGSEQPGSLAALAPG